MLTDLRLAVRRLVKSPGFASVALATLALCIGANLAIFAVVDSVLLRPLPFPTAGRLVTIVNSYPGAGLDRDGASLTSYYERRGTIPAFSKMSALGYATAIVGDAGATERMDVLRVSPEFFSTLGVHLAMGRPFREEEMTYQTDGVAIITDSYWRKNYNADPHIIGREIRMDAFTRVIVGVLPAGFRYLSSDAQILGPLSSNPDERGIRSRYVSGYEVIARLEPGATLAQAQAQIDANHAAHAAEFPWAKEIAAAGFRETVTPLHADHVRSIRPTLLLLEAGALSLLLIGGVNLVNLLLIRASSRAKEFAIRQSMGASRRHVVFEVMVETGLLTLSGGILGVLVGSWGIRLLALLGANQLPLGGHVAFDGRLAAVSLLGTLALGVLIALPIAGFNLRNHLAHALKSESRGGTGSRSGHRLRDGFVVAQIALAFVLLSGSALLGLSLRRLTAVSPGFRPDHVLAGQIDLPWKNYHEDGAGLGFAERLVEAARRQSDLLAVGVITDAPVKGTDSKTAENPMTIVGYTYTPGVSPILHGEYGVTGDYFAAMGIRLLEGRFLETADSHREARACVVDEDFARRYWPRGGALGQRIWEGPPQNRPLAEAFTVVGVVAAVKQRDLADRHANGAIYFPFRYMAPYEFFVVARTVLPPESFGISLQQIVRGLDPGLPVSDLRSMETRINDTLVTRRSPVFLSGIFAFVALVLATIGTYGVLSYAVAQRRREIGIRIALGAQTGQIRSQFLAIGLRHLAAGAGLGIIGAWWAGRAMQGMLFGVPAFDFATLAGTAVVMGVVSLAACMIPALRAAHISPTEALAEE
jgi:predicted permease